jgi:hypothetical protein
VGQFEPLARFESGRWSRRGGNGSIGGELPFPIWWSLRPLRRKADLQLALKVGRPKRRDRTLVRAQAREVAGDICGEDGGHSSGTPALRRPSVYRARSSGENNVAVA